MSRALLCIGAAALALGFTLLPGALSAHDPQSGGGAAAKPATAAPDGHEQGGRGHGDRQHGPGQGGHDHEGQQHGHERQGETHVHAPVPPEYRSAHLPAAAWTNPRLIARGREIYMSRCSVCHGERGDGKGPAAVGLPINPSSFRDEKMVGEMTGNYWFWRVSEGGLVEPFKSMGSVMPAWKDELSVQDRWAVIAYTHSLSGHQGPHVVSEHPQMLGSSSHAGH